MQVINVSLQWAICEMLETVFFSHGHYRPKFLYLFVPCSELHAGYEQ